MPFYSSSAAFCLLRSHHVLLFRLIASDCLSCLAAFGHSLSSPLLSLSLSPCHSHIIMPSSSVLLFCLQSVLLFFATRQLLSEIEKLGCGCHTRAPRPISVSCVCMGAEARSNRGDLYKPFKASHFQLHAGALEKGHNVAHLKLLFVRH